MTREAGEKRRSIYFSVLERLLGIDKYVDSLSRCSLATIYLAELVEDYQTRDNRGSQHSARKLKTTMTTINEIDSSTIRYPAFLTEDAPRPPDNRRSIEPRERIDLLVECIAAIQANGTSLPIAVGRLFTLANQTLRARNTEDRVFNFIEFKAVVRCLVMDSERGFGIAEGRLFERESNERVGERDGEAGDEEEVVRQVREAMAEVDEGAGVSVWGRA